MIPVSDKARAYISNRNGRYFEAKLVVNGYELNCDIRKIKIKKGSCGGGSLQPSSIYSTRVEAKIRTDGQINNGDKLEIYISATRSGDNSLYKICTVYVRDKKERNGEISFNGEGTISAKLGWQYVGEVGESIQAMINGISIVSGTTIIVSSGLDTSYAPNQEANVDGLLQREVLEKIAGCFFGYATEDVDGNIIIRSFKDLSGDVVEFKEDRTTSFPDIYDTQTVQAISVSDFVYPYDTDFVNVSLNNPLMTEELFNMYYDNFVGLSYTPYNAELTLGDFTIEPWDTISINGKTSIITEITIDFSGGIKTTLSAPTLEEGSEYSRTETDMKSDILSSMLPKINTGGTGGVAPDPTGRYTDIYKSSGTNIAIKDGYMCVFESVGNSISGYSNFVNELKWLDAKYMPAYKVSICVPSYTKSSGSSLTYRTCSQIDLLPELNENGKVKFVVSSAYLDPKQWSKTYNRYMYEATKSLQQYVYFTVRANWILASAIDGIRGEESDSTEQ